MHCFLFLEWSSAEVGSVQILSSLKMLRNKIQIKFINTTYYYKQYLVLVFFPFPFFFSFLVLVFTCIYSTKSDSIQPKTIPPKFCKYCQSLAKGNGKKKRRSSTFPAGERAACGRSLWRGPSRASSRGCRARSSPACLP